MYAFTCLKGVSKCSVRMSMSLQGMGGRGWFVEGWGRRGESACACACVWGGGVTCVDGRKDAQIAHIPYIGIVSMYTHVHVCVCILMHLYVGAPYLYLSILTCTPMYIFAMIYTHVHFPLFSCVLSPCPYIRRVIYSAA